MASKPSREMESSRVRHIHSGRGAPPIYEAVDHIQRAFDKRNARDLKEEMDICIQRLVVEEQHAYFLLGLISYVLSKIAQKPRYRDPRLLKKMSLSLADARSLARMNNMSALSDKFDRLLIEITALETTDKRFVISMVEKGRTKIGALLYAQGLSLNRAVSLTGARKQEVINYSGKTMMADRFGKTLPVSERLKNARSILK